MQDVIRITYDVALCHPDKITKIWSLSHPDNLAIPSISSGWHIVDALCHPDDLPGVGISSGWVTANSFCHPDDILFHFMSSGWLNWGWFLIRMSYGNVIMSSGWDTLPFLSHPDEIANFDFPQHAVALQRFRREHQRIHGNTQPRPSNDITRLAHLLNISILIYEFISNRPIRSFIFNFICPFAKASEQTPLPFSRKWGPVGNLLYSSAIKQLRYENTIPSRTNRQL